MTTYPIPPRSYSINLWLSAGALCCTLALVFSSLTTHLPDSFFTHDGRNMCRIADDILAIHGLALIVLSILQKIWQSSVHFTYIAIIMLSGIILFCTGVFYIALTGRHPLFPIAPIGGSLLITGWLYLTILGLFLRERS